MSSVDQQNIIELTAYIIDSFGNPTRIDYGTGHEMSFCMFLCGLYKVNLLKQSDSKATVNVIFLRLIYVKLIFKLIKGFTFLTTSIKLF